MATTPGIFNLVIHISRVKEGTPEPTPISYPELDASPSPYAQHPNQRQHRRIPPMIPLAPARHLAHPAIHARKRTPRDHDGAQRAPAAEERGGVGGQAPEDVAGAVDDHDVVDELARGLVGRVHEGREEGEGVFGAQHGVDAEAEGDGARGAGEEGEERELRGGRHDVVVVRSFGVELGELGPVGEVWNEISGAIETDSRGGTATELLWDSGESYC